VSPRARDLVCNAAAAAAVVGVFVVAALWAFVVLRNIVVFLVTL
jgi:hypothetical protein